MMPLGTGRLGGVAASRAAPVVRGLAAAAPLAAALAAVGLALLLLVSPAQIAPSLALLGVLALPAVFGIALCAPIEERRTLVLLFLAALGVRCVVALLTSLAGSSPFFAVDDDKYAQLGWELARFWAGEGGWPTDLHGQLAYYAWNALLYSALGPVPLAPALANAVAGALTAVLAHAMARDLAGPRAGLLAGLLTAFWPSLVLWSSLNLKDAFALLAILMALRGGQRLTQGLALRPLLLAGLGLLALSQLRAYLVPIAAVAALAGWAVARLRATPMLALALGIGAAVLLPFVFPVESLVEEVSFESLERTRQKLAIGASAYQSEATLATPGSALRFLPLGLAYFLFAPAPWQLLNARQFLTLPEMLVWYGLVYFVARGLIQALRTRVALASPLVLFACVATLSYSLVEGNLGTAYRHRAQVIVLYLVCAGVGLAGARRRPTLAPAWRGAET